MMADKLAVMWAAAMAPRSVAQKAACLAERRVVNSVDQKEAWKVGVLAGQMAARTAVQMDGSSAVPMAALTVESLAVCLAQQRVAQTVA